MGNNLNTIYCHWDHENYSYAILLTIKNLLCIKLIFGTGKWDLFVHYGYDFAVSMFVINLWQFCRILALENGLPEVQSKVPSHLILMGRQRPCPAQKNSCPSGPSPHSVRHPVSSCPSWQSTCPSHRLDSGRHRFSDSHLKSPCPHVRFSEIQKYK